MNIYQSVTDRILNQLETGVIPWRKTWSTGLPKSLATGREYRGINLLILGSSDFSSGYWLTYREALRLGGHVRKGERAMAVVYWKWRTAEELKRLIEEKKVANPAPCVPFTSAVFNLDQVEGVPPPESEAPVPPDRRFEVAGLLLDVMPDVPEIVHSASKEPAYEGFRDRITMPHLGQFESGDEYYATLFHELVHSTSHPRRLNRLVEAEGNAIEKYSFEELVAELGAAFLCGFAGLKNTMTEQLQSSYIAGWAQVFRQDSHMLVKAASAAQRAADYIRGKKVPDAEPKES